MTVRRQLSIVSGLLLLAAVIVTPTPAAPAAASAETAKAKRVVVSPREGRVVRGNHVRLRVRVPDRALLRARLNGARVGDEFERARRGVRTLRASVSHGLRRGRNVLRARVHRPGRRGRTTTVRFRVHRSRALVGSGRDRTVVLGSRWPLNGRVLKALGDPRRASVRWRVIRAPRRSRAHATGRPRREGTRAQAPGAAPPPALLSAPAQLSPGFRPDVTGTYTLQLTTGSGPASTTDVVQLDAMPQSLLVELDTMSGDPSNPGVTVGGTNYPLSQAAGSGPLQVLVLTREHLELNSNLRFNSASALGSALGGMSADKLVIVAWQAVGGFSGDLDGALAQIGWPKLGAIDPTRPGSLSAIGVPGWQRGDADAKLNEYAPGAPPRAGRIQGYLTPDQNREFGFLPSQRVPFSYSPSTPRPPDTPSACGATCAGFLVRFQDPYTLGTGRFNYYALGDPSLSAGDRNNEASRMINDFQQTPGTVITIQAVSTPKPDGTYLPPVGAIDRSLLRQVAAVVADAGGSRDGFNSVARMSGSAASRGATYTLVGWKGAGEAAGAEAAARANGATAAPVLTGVLRPNRQLQFRPAGVKQNANETDRLSTVTLEPPTTSWPLDDDPGAKAALSWLGSQDSRLGPNPRTAYWLQDFAVVGTWLDIKDTISAVTYSPGNGFSQADFDTAKTQLLKELGWVFKVRSYTTQLSTVFQQSNQPAWAQTHVIADGIYGSVKPPDDTTFLRWSSFVDILLKLAGPFTAGATNVVAQLLDFGVWGFGALESGAPTYDGFAVAADQLGAQLETLAMSSEQAVERMGDVVVNDYAKLSVVGQNALCNPGPGCPPGWSFTGDDATQASADINRGIQRLAYETFIPMAYATFQLARNGNLGGIPSVKRSAPPRDTNGYITVHGRPEWTNAPRLAYTSLLRDLDPNGVDNWYDTFILHIPSVYGQIWLGYPPVKTLSHMFRPVPNTTDPTDDGLGMNLNDMVRNASTSWYWGNQADELYWTRWIY
jgi:hypothetical protein